MDDIEYNGVPLEEHLKNEKPLEWSPDDKFVWSDPELPRGPVKWITTLGSYFISLIKIL